MFETIIITNSSNITQLLEKGNYEGDVLISQQINTNNSIIKREKLNKKVTLVQSNTKGIGFNRNIALFSSSKKICVLGDDDLVFHNGYLETVKKAYYELPNADIIIFDLDEQNDNREKDQKIKRIRWYNYMRYGAARYTFKRKSILKNNIVFNTYFGASTYGSGEDTLFLQESLKKGLKIYYYPNSLATIENKRQSSWFRAYDKRYYFDKGALFYALSSKSYKVLLLRHIFKTRARWKKLGFNFNEIYKSGLKGAESFKNDQ